MLIQIETPRLILREFTRSDRDQVHEYACDPEVSRYMEWGPNSLKETTMFLDQVMQNQREKPRYVHDFAVTLKDGGKLIGACGFRILPMDRQQAAIGYCYNRNYWRQGFGAEACRALIDYVFTNHQMHRLYATCDAENVGSAGVMLKCGMRQEAHFVQDKLIKERWRDTLLFAILRSEWE
jgi:[ribosomal protein S5]-alanine N-acetyltransferase